MKLNEDLYAHRPSRLYHIKPQRLGEPYVESLVGYLKRLAEVLCVSVGNLLNKEIIPELKQSYLRINHERFIGKKTKELNNWNDLSENIVQILTEKTLVDGLRYLTTGLWSDVIYSRYMFREYQAWCPLCYEESLQSQKPVYEQFLWNFKDVQICGIHQVKLSDRCPYCDSQLSILSFVSRVGFCNKCKSWLGLTKYENNHITHLDLEWENWVYSNIGEMLASAPTLESVNALNFSKNVSNLVSTNHISLRSLGKKLNITHKTISNWIAGKKPILRDILILSFLLDCSLVDILTKEMNFFNYSLDDKRTILAWKNPKYKIDVHKLKLAINDAMSLNEGLSLNELASLTGVHRNTIRKHFPNEVAKLKVEYNKILNKSKANKLSTIRSAMKSLNNEGIYPSMKALKRLLGKRVIINDEEREVWLTTMEELACSRDDNK